jgi:spore coat polysaccharide biosynthesis protein SpsF
MTNTFQDISLRHITNFKESDVYRATIHNLIPGGAHTYSKGDDQFPLLSPAAIAYGRGSHIWDIDGNEYLDCPMGLTSVSLGHAYKPVIDAVGKELQNGVNFQRPSNLEKEMAEVFLSIVPVHDRIKFAKNGSIVTTAAVKLARAKTGRKLIAFPKDHPFYSYDDWFIGTTPCNKGIPEEITNLSVTFQSYDLDSVKRMFETYPGEIACVITEPEKSDFRTDDEKESYIKELIKITHQNGALFIMDEMVTGFKTAFPGSMAKWNLEPDMATWGKGIANGFSFCALTGKKDVMDLGGITNAGEEKVFLISTTHGGETHAMSAAIATIEEFKKNDVVRYNHAIGDQLIALCNKVIIESDLTDFIKISPTNWLVGFSFLDANKEVSNGMRTLVMQEMIKRGILFQGAFVPCFSHSESDVLYFAKAFQESISTYRSSLETGFESLLIGPPAKAVFRRLL